MRIAEKVGAVVGPEAITKNAWALGIFLLALVLRLVYLAEIAATPYFDTLVLDAEEYDRLAEQLLQGNWLLGRAGSYVHGPFYILVLALLKLCGADYLGLRVFQAVLGALSCVLIYRIAGRVFPHPVPLIAALLAAGYWPFIFYNGELLATTLVLFIELLLAALLLRGTDRISWRVGACAGILLALLVITRSNTLLLLPVLLWWFYQRAGSGTKHRRALLLAFCLALVLALSPLLIYYQAVQGSPLPFQGGWSFYMGNNPDADGTPYARQGLDWQRLELLPYQEGSITRAAKGQFYLTAGLRFIGEHPAAALHLLYRKFRLFWHAFEIPVSADLRYYERHSHLAQILIFNFGIVVPLALMGMVWGWRRYRDYALLYGFILVYLVTGLLFSVCARYRLPALPFLIVFAAQGIWQLKTQLWSGNLLGRGAFLLLLGAAVALVHTGVDQEKVDHLRSSWLLGHVYMRKQQYDLAEQVYLRSVRETPGDSDVYNSLAVAYQRLGRPQEAEATFRKSIEAAPDHARPWINLGNHYLKLQRLDEARTALEQALGSDPRPLAQYEGHYSLGNVHLYQKAYSRAHQAFTRALEAQQRPQAYFGLSVACAYLGEDDAQLRALEQAVQLAPTFALALRNLGVLYLQKEDYPAAEKALLQSLQYSPNSALAYQHLGMLYSKLGQPERARAAFATARRLRPSSAAPPGKRTDPN